MREKALAMIRYTFELPEGDGDGQKLEPPAAGRASEIKTPTLLIIGDQDAPLMFPALDFLIEQISGAKKVVMPGAAHLPNMEQPETFNKIALDFLSGY